MRLPILQIDLTQLLPIYKHVPFDERLSKERMLYKEHSKKPSCSEPKWRKYFSHSFHIVNLNWFPSKKQKFLTFVSEFTIIPKFWIGANEFIHGGDSNLQWETNGSFARLHINSKFAKFCKYRLVLRIFYLIVKLHVGLFIRSGFSFKSSTKVFHSSWKFLCHIFALFYCFWIVVIFM